MHYRRDDDTGSTGRRHSVRSSASFAGAEPWSHTDKMWNSGAVAESRPRVGSTFAGTSISHCWTGGDAQCAAAFHAREFAAVDFRCKLAEAVFSKIAAGSSPIWRLTEWCIWYSKVHFATLVALCALSERLIPQFRPSRCIVGASLASQRIEFARSGRACGSNGGRVLARS